MGITSKQRGTHVFPDGIQLGSQQQGLPLVATAVISAADIVNTAAGKFGHASGQQIVAAPGADYALLLIKAFLKYQFGVAAYTLGGNITLNWSGGGAALTGLVSAANSVGAAGSKNVGFYPLATAGVNLLVNTPIHLVSSAAFTQPGTATGTITMTVWYQKVPTAA